MSEDLRNQTRWLAESGTWPLHRTCSLGEGACVVYLK